MPAFKKHKELTEKLSPSSKKLENSSKKDPSEQIIQVCEQYDRRLSLRSSSQFNSSISLPPSAYYSPAQKLASRPSFIASDTFRK